MVIGDVGVGKSWWISYNLMNLDPSEYHVIIIDLRFRKRRENLEQSLEGEINEFLNHYITNLQWIYPDFKSIYGDDFDPDDPKIKEKMRDKALSLDLSEYNKRRLRYYNDESAPTLIVAFDNIDHFDEDEQLTVLDMCRRIIGSPAGVKVLLTMRPTTRLPKSRLGIFLGYAVPRPVIFESPNLRELVRKRFSTNNEGNRISIRDRVTRTYYSRFNHFH